MSVELTHQQIQELLGVFALDAVDGDEAEVIELHLRDCPRCRAEVTEQREVAALLAHTGATAPEGVWVRILEELEPVPPALRMPSLPAPGSVPEAGGPELGAGTPEPDAATEDASRDQADAAVVDLSSRRSSVRMRTVIAIVSAAAIVVAVLVVVTLNQSNRLNRLESSLRDVSVDRIAARAMSDPHASIGKLTSADTGVNAPVVVNDKGMGYLLASKLPKLPKQRTYQLWGQVGGSVLSLGVFDGQTDVVQFQVGTDQRADLSRLMVTEENAPGVAASKNPALLSGTV